jgi:hypothetical protein
VGPPADVRIRLPRDDGVQHHPAADQVQPDFRPGGGQRALRHLRVRADHRRPDARVHPRRLDAAAPMGAADHAGRDGRDHDRLLVPLPVGRRVGLGRVLPVGPDPRGAAHQPVLDAGERGVRRAPGQAHVRVHRRWRRARRHDRRRGDGAAGRAARHQYAAAVQRGNAARLREHRLGDRQAQRRRGRLRRHRRRRERHQPRAGVRPAARVAADPVDRSRDQLRLAGRRPDRPAAEHGGRSVQGARRDRFDRRVPGTGSFLPVSRGFRHPGLDHAADPPLPGHRLRADDPADEPGPHGAGDHPQRGALGPRDGERAGPVVPLHGG